MLYSLKSRINSRDTTSRTAARITANCEPIPPSTTIASTKADSAKVKDSGLTKPWRAANNVPAQPHQIEENDPVGWVVLHAKEIAEGIPAAFAGAAAKLQTKQRRFRDLADAVRAAKP